MERHVGHLLRRTYAIARTHSAQALARLGDVSPVQASVLATVAIAPMTQAELGRRIGMEPANTHALVRRMLAAGMIELAAPAEQRTRTRHVALTAHGRALADRLPPSLAAASDATLAALSTDERDILATLLRRIIAANDIVEGGR